jgi:tight adherence protein C
MTTNQHRSLRIPIIEMRGVDFAKGSVFEAEGHAMNTVIGLMVSTAIMLLYNGVIWIRTPRYTDQLIPFRVSSDNPAPRNLYQRWIRPSSKWLADRCIGLRGLTDDNETARLLAQAGKTGTVSTHEFFGLRILCALGGLLAGIIWFRTGPIIILILPFACFFMPWFWLLSSAKERQRSISTAIPDFIDLLAACIGAGLNIDVALALIVARGEGPLYEELQRAFRELRIGEVREQVFQRLCDRNPSKELRAFIDLLLEAEIMGVPIAHVLERLSNDMRTKRERYHKEQVELLYRRMLPLAVISVLAAELLTMALMNMATRNIADQLLIR